MRVTQKYLRSKLEELDDGVLYAGAHSPTSKQFCALEFVNKVEDDKYNDAPTNMPDIRRINDARWSSNEIRTKHLLPVIVAYWGWKGWDETKKKAIINKVVIYTVNRIISELPHLKENSREQCRKAKTIKEARAAAYAADAAAYADYAAYAAAANADYAAYAAAYAAVADADAAADAAAADAAADVVLIKVCKLWIQAVKDYNKENK
jgi:hypothetical protein